MSSCFDPCSKLLVQWMLNLPNSFSFVIEKRKSSDLKLVFVNLSRS
jgi:hypothetical protein